MATTVPHDQRSRGIARNLGEQRRRIPWTVWVLACIGAALLAGYQLSIPPQEPPGDAIRRELKAAAADVAAEMRIRLVLGPSPSALAAMRRHFSGQDVSIATSPAASIIAVTLHGVDHKACIEAAAKARRMDGSVVVMLQGYGAPEDCGSRNEMTWWIMP
jgi:hypothetical protein